MTDDYFMLPRFDRRKTIVCNGVAGLFAVGCLIAHVAGLDGVWLGVEASLVLLAMAGMNAVLRLLTRKPFWLEPWERSLEDLANEPIGPSVRAAMDAASDGDEFTPVWYGGRQAGKSDAMREWAERELQRAEADPYANDYVNVHDRRNAENARVLAEHLGTDGVLGASELPDDRVIDMANGKA